MCLVTQVLTRVMGQWSGMPSSLAVFLEVYKLPSMSRITFARSKLDVRSDPHLNVNVVNLWSQKFMKEYNVPR